MEHAALLHDPTRIIVAAAPPDCLGLLSDSLKQAMPHACVSALRQDCRTNLAPIDVAIVRLDQRDLTPLAAVLELYDDLGRPELVVVVEHLLDPAAHALARLGVRRIVESPDLLKWLKSSELLLRAVARGRAAERQLKGLSNSWVDRPWGQGKRISRLFEAEQRFREAYVRLLLSVAGSRREAAEMAGIPYRTFCQIVATLDLANEEANRRVS
jgi:hypothetical protein